MDKVKEFYTFTSYRIIGCDMLKELTLENFLSFDRVGMKLTDKGNRPLNHAFIYGENGSGKTNLIDSLMMLGRSTLTLISEENGGSENDNLKKLLDALRTENIDIRIKYEPKDVSSLAGEYRMISSEGPMILSFVFSIDGHDARYTLEFDEDNTLRSESLDFIISKKSGNLFRFTRDEKRMQKDLVSQSYRKEINDLLVKYWGRHTFLSILTREESLKNVKFMTDNISASLYTFLRYVRSLVIVKKDARFAQTGKQIQLPSGTIPAGDRPILDNAEMILSKFFTRLYSDVTQVHFLTENLNDNRIRYDLYFEKRIAGTVRSIPAEKESSGTKNLMNMLQFLLQCADGKTVVIDEMDTGIHDLLVSQLMEQCIPDIDGQLIATTHNTALMDYSNALNTFIIEIDRNGFKRIRNIQSIEPPNVNTNVQKRYLQGHYSGIPLVADIGLKDILLESKKMGSE
ncbi:MAG: hypothetical protein E7Z65_07765 [Thermoplasmata archaeon]|nr:hypothetical protein [Thermoplasmata archaeon]